MAVADDRGNIHFADLVLAIDFGEAFDSDIASIFVPTTTGSIRTDGVILAAIKDVERFDPGVNRFHLLRRDRPAACGYRGQDSGSELRLVAEFRGQELKSRHDDLGTQTVPKEARSFRTLKLIQEPGHCEALFRRPIDGRNVSPNRLTTILARPIPDHVANRTASRFTQQKAVTLEAPVLGPTGILAIAVSVNDGSFLIRLMRFDKCLDVAFDPLVVFP